MKARYIQIAGGKKYESYQFDRSNLIEGYTSDGRHIPEGGVLLSNGNLAGYLRTQAGGSWTVIGKIDPNDINYKYIPQHQVGGKKDHKATSNNVAHLQNGRGGSRSRNLTEPKKQVSLKTAVKMLREYYRHNFN